MFSGFQSGAFQNNAFQIVSGAVPAQAATGGWDRHAHSIAFEEYKRKVKRLSQELKEAEEQRLEAEKALSEKLSKKKALQRQQELTNLQNEIQALAAQKTALLRLIQDEEETFLVLYSLPFVH